MDFFAFLISSQNIQIELDNEIPGVISKQLLGKYRSPRPEKYKNDEIRT